MNRLTIGIATRGRRDLVEHTAIETLKNCTENTKIVILADHDDDLTGISLPKQVILSVRQREDSVGGKWNRMIEIAPADVYMAMCDYGAQVTKGFDRNVLNAAALFHDGIGCVYQDMANLSFPSYQGMTAKMAQIMGGFYVEHFPYWFVDHWLDDLCKMTGRYVYAEGEIQRKPRPGTGGTQDFREPGLWATLYDALYAEREAMANRLLAEMDEPEWRKAMLRAQWPLVHQRSRILNQMVRGMTGNAPFDDRYNRIRAKGISLLEKLYYDMEKRAA
jgi:hypothetical protein